MRRIIFIALLLVATSGIAAGQATKGKSDQGVEQAVAGRVKEFFDALRKGDAAGLGSFYADDYSIVLDNGSVLTKAQRLEWFKSNAGRLAELEYSDLKVRAYGNTAVVTGHATTKGPDGATMNQRFMQVWVRGQGDWRMVAGQITTIAPSQ